MPMYEYRCERCGERFEELVRASTKDEEVRCPTCGERRSKKQLSAFATKAPSASSAGASSAGASSAGRCGPPGSGFT